MIAVCDVNTIWRYRPFDAMAEITDVLGFSPCDGMACSQKAWATGELDVIDVRLPPSWASKTAWLGQRLLWRRMKAEARCRGKEIECVVVTSPHYLTLLDLLPEEINTVYYASDDFRSYIGWNNMAEREAKVVRRVDHAFFISEELALRACNEYGVDTGKVSVSMNGTEDRFLPSKNEVLPLNPPAGSFTRPIVGVVGGMGDRLDFELLKVCADLPGLGTLLLVGSLGEPSPRLTELLRHPKCVSVGFQPHDVMHGWFKCLDVGLIPYIASEFNKFCSPMRLFDHLGSGYPIVATASCSQMRNFDSVVEVCGGQDRFLERLERILAEGFVDLDFGTRARVSPMQTWKCRAEAMLRIMDGINEDT